VLLESRLLSLSRQGFEPGGEFGLKLCLSRFTILNYTKMRKYEALEKNAVSDRKSPARRQSPVRSFA
jgi:hypothetical protein